MESSQKIKSSLIREFRPGDKTDLSDNTYVYHYTSPEAFLSIIQNGSIRFSDVRYMNDKSEAIFVVKRLIEFSEKKKNVYPLFCEALNKLLKGNNFDALKNLAVDKVQYVEFPGLKFEKQRNFIFCTSTESDSLNMWNYYASGGKYSGYNIGLSVQNFLKSFDTESEEFLDAFIVYHGNVIYKEKEQFEIIEELAKQIEKPIQYDKSPQAIHRRAATIRNFIEIKGLFFKHSSFSSENEYRFLLSIAEKRIPHTVNEAKKYYGVFNKQIYEDFYIRNGVVVPFLKITIPPCSIGRITMSPMTEFEIARNSINELLDIKQIRGTNNSKVRVCKSQIPIRF